MGIVRGETIEKPAEDEVMVSLNYTHLVECTQGYHCNSNVFYDPQTNPDMNSFRLTPSDYQKLLDRGWRRSGKHCYNPINKHTCCPNYSITCKTTQFKLSWSQRKCIENVNSFLITGDIKDRVKLNYANTCEADSRLLAGHEQRQQEEAKKSRSFEELKASPKAKDRRFVRSCERKAKLYDMTIDEAMKQIRHKWNKRRSVALTLEDYLYPKISSLKGSTLDKDVEFKPKHKLTIRMLHVKSQTSKQTRKDEHSVMVQYQKAVHKEGRREWSMSRYCDFLVTTPIITEPLSQDNYDYIPSQSSTSDTTNNVDLSDTYSIDIYANRDNPFLLVKPAELPTAFGTYHSYYYLDDKLIAVGVLDLLPKCLTTVYFFYDPDYSFLNLGIYSGLHEISMVRQMVSHYQGNDENKLIHYYLGFYVHECKKMHYKTRFRPSYLLCSKTFYYVPTEICLQKLATQKYAQFADDDEQSSQQVVDSLGRLLEVPITCSVIRSNQMINYLIWLEDNLGNEYVDLLVNAYLMAYAQLVGRDLLSKLCLQLNAVHRSLMDRYNRQAASNTTGGIETRASSTKSHGH